MRILWLTENYPPRRGGMAQACDRIVSNLRQSGLTVDVVFFCHGAASTRVIEQQNGREIIFATSDSGGHDLNCLFNFLTRPGAHVSYTHLVAFGGNLPILALPVFSAWLKCAAVTMFRGNDFDLGIFSPPKRIALGAAITASNSVCVLSNELAARIAALFPQASLQVIANGIDTTTWRAEKFDLDSAAAWRAGQVSGGRLVVGLFGQFKAKKGGRFLLENVLKAGLQDSFHFMIVGDVETDMQTWLDENSNRLHFTRLPFLDRLELLGRYPACDYIALPSHYDGMPNVLLEAGALGIPVIAARTGGISDVTADLLDAVTFHPGDDAACRQALWNAGHMTGPQLHELGKALQNRIFEHFTAARETAAYLAVFKQTAKGKNNETFY